MLKKSAFFIFLIFIFVSCSRPTVKPDSFETFTTRKIGTGKNVLVGVVFSQSELARDKDLEQTAEEIFIEELKHSGFNIMENSRFNHMVNKYSLVKNGFSMSGELPKADYIIIATLTRFEKYGSGDFYLFYGDITEVCDVKVNVTLIDTKTARTYSGAASGRTSLKDFKILFLSNSHDIGTQMFEDAYRVAVRKAIEKINL